MTPRNTAVSPIPVFPMTPMRLAARRAAAALLLVLAAAVAEAASAQVVVVLSRPPVGRLGVADLYRLQAISPAGPAAVSFRGTLTEASQGLLYEVETDVVELRTGANTLRVADLEPVRVVTEPRDRRYRDALLRTGEPPAGDYEVCVFALDAGSGAEVGRDCYTQAIDPLSPPLLVSPGQGETVIAQLVTFVWTPPVPVPRDRVGYRLRVVEMLTGQVPEVAARANPAVFETDRLTATTLVYPASARPLRPGSYAWTVGALVGGETVAQSEVGSFAVGRAVAIPGTTTIAFPIQIPPGSGVVTVPGPVLTAPVAQLPLDQRLVLGSCSSQCDLLSDAAPTIAVAVGGPVPNQPAQAPVLAPGASQPALAPGIGVFGISPETIENVRSGAAGGNVRAMPDSPIAPGTVVPAPAVPPRVRTIP